jgi:expansin (peptidoglycan-binding protein)
MFNHAWENMKKDYNHFVTICILLQLLALICTSIQEATGSLIPLSGEYLTLLNPKNFKTVYGTSLNMVIYTTAY